MSCIKIYVYLIVSSSHVPSMPKMINTSVSPFIITWLGRRMRSIGNSQWPLQALVYITGNSVNSVNFT